MTKTLLKARKRNAKIQRNLFDNSLSGLSCSGSILASYLISPVAWVNTFCVLIHEIGHYLCAKLLGLKAKPPIIIGIGYASIGYVKVYSCNRFFARAIAIAGPTSGAYFAALLSLLLYILNIQLTYFVISSIIISEIVQFIFSKDGKVHGESGPKLQFL